MADFRDTVGKPGSIARAVFAGLLGLALVACRDEPAPTLPAFLSPDGRQVLLDARADLINCQDAQVAITFGEIINLSDPVGYAASMAGQSAGQGSPDLPVDSALSGVVAIEEICCRNIERRIELHIINSVIPSREAGTLSAEENRFWRQLSWYIGSGKGGCRLPDETSRDYGWPSG